MSPDVFIAGGGPAGSAAAILLARAGVRVTLAEKRREAHHKVCGEFVSGEAVETARDLGLDLSALGAVPIQVVAYATPSGGVVRRTLPFPAVSLSRLVLDEALLGAAEAAGARVLRGVSVQGFDLDPDGGTTVRLDGDGPVQVPAFFAATGKHDLRGHARPEGRQGDLVGLKMLYRRAVAPSDPVVTIVPFRDGYAGLQPVGQDAVNLCLLVSRRRFADHGGRFDDLVRSLVAEAPEIARQLDGAEPLLDKALAVTRIPYGYVRRVTEGPWWLGDQAAVIPSFAGDGIAIALESARQAVDTLLSGGTAAGYQRRFASTVSRQVGAATVLSQLMVRPSWQRPSALLAAVPGVLAGIGLLTRVRLPTGA
ncbi:NAD(P)/FAD-dependent oxidoreductase [Chthonobacter albigriseus]|uniref:NAD(P)/FAD-dependent oxidoreductase n=1 Tax=Chthonobacter albigriseus TaxID=1683161 RepID=UPI0015EE7DCC|nr:FAD-dependent monooxygenase [Chthonobacter albigriseus]